jgi:hypothetical protein
MFFMANTYVRNLLPELDELLYVRDLYVEYM